MSNLEDKKLMLDDSELEKVAGGEEGYSKSSAKCPNCQKDANMYYTPIGVYLTCDHCGHCAKIG